MILIRYALILLIIYLIIRSFVTYREKDKTITRGPESESGKKVKSKGVSKKIGEYVDYEELDK